AGRVLDLLIDEGVVVGRVPGQAHVDDVRAVVDGPADTLAHRGHRAAGPGAHDPHRHNGHIPVDAGDAPGVVGRGRDNSGHHGAVADVGGVVGVVGGRLTAGKVAAVDDVDPRQVGMLGQ